MVLIFLNVIGQMLTQAVTTIVWMNAEVLVWDEAASPPFTEIIVH